MLKSKITVNRFAIIILVRLYAVVTVATNLLQIRFLASVSHTDQHQISIQIKLSNRRKASRNWNLFVKTFLEFSFSLLGDNSQESNRSQYNWLSLTWLFLYSILNHAMYPRKIFQNCGNFKRYAIPK